MSIRCLLVAALLSSPLAALAADPPPDQKTAPAAAPAPQAAAAQTGERPAAEPQAVFPKLMTVQEADQTPEQKAEAARQAQSEAVGERLMSAARSMRNMGMLALSGILGLIVSGLVGGLIALGVNAYRERRAARQP